MTPLSDALCRKRQGGGGGGRQRRALDQRKVSRVFVWQPRAMVQPRERRVPVEPQAHRLEVRKRRAWLPREKVGVRRRAVDGGQVDSAVGHHERRVALHIPTNGRAPAVGMDQPVARKTERARVATYREQPPLKSKMARSTALPFRGSRQLGSCLCRRPHHQRRSVHPHEGRVIARVQQQRDAGATRSSLCASLPMASPVVSCVVEPAQDRQREPAAALVREWPAPSRREDVKELLAPILVVASVHCAEVRKRVASAEVVDASIERRPPAGGVVAVACHVYGSPL